MPAKPKAALPTSRTQRGEARDHLLRSHAAEIFLRRGYDGVSLDEILREAGGSKTNVYSFFGGKEGLFLAAIEDVIVEVTAPLKELRLAGLPLRGGLEKFARTLHEVLLQERHLALQRLIVAEGARHPDLAIAWHRVGPQATCALLDDFLRDKKRTGEVREDVATRRVAILFHDMVLADMLNRAMMKIDGGPPPAEQRATIETALDFTIAAIAPRA